MKGLEKDMQMQLTPF